MTSTLPKVRHIYQNHHLDSTRWDRFTPRGDDIFIATSIKSGTTWMQAIVMNLVFGDQASPDKVSASLWLEARMRPIDDVIDTLEAQSHRRFIKTHLPLDGLPYYSEPKYIVVGRDARDVFMSLWNHYKNYTPEFYKRVNEELPDLVGAPLPPCPQYIGDFWYRWITQGWFDWEREGFPFWSNLGHTQSWWDFRGLPNFLFVHFNDLLEDAEGEIKRVADFLDVEVSDERVNAIVQATTFDSMKANADVMTPGGGRQFVGGAQTFFNKGTNGRWKQVLVPEDLSLYKDAVSRIMSPVCAQWLENGRQGIDSA